MEIRQWITGNNNCEVPSSAKASKSHRLKAKAVPQFLFLDVILECRTTVLTTQNIKCLICTGRVWQRTKCLI